MGNKDNNTLSGFHIRGENEGVLKISMKKYRWHIPKSRRFLNIQLGDIVGVNKTKAPVLVTEVFREDIEDTGKSYKSIFYLYDRAPKKE
ncbi:MAG TPA: hypothetical protein IAA20_07725 [Candidatus Enterococcus avicola]|uniref:Uncharacterized protein n=1 Tax=Candidatus Enterococcus avicola TaxID=2838561 RepID=A0A9D2F896_9ENTE|nr:hypothetical protein [Candidatus Enterococcus avicola]